MSTIDSPSHPEAAPRLAALPEFAVFAATGADAATFLHGQLTQDVLHLGADQARLAGYCTPKGRLLATLLAWRHNTGDAATDGIQMLALADAAEALTRRLAMFVLRAKARISRSDLRVYGLLADAGTTSAAEQLAGGKLPATPWQATELAGVTWIAIPSAADAQRRWLAIAPADNALEAQADATAADDWRRADLSAGLPWIGGATADLFIPQNVNFDCIAGINFRKGCYPGQEIVARSHYRGTLKRRMGVGTLQDASLHATPGADVYDPERPQEPAGRVVSSAPGAVLLEAPLEALAAGKMHYGSADGPLITVGNLPYSLDKPAN